MKQIVRILVFIAAFLAPLSMSAQNDGNDVFTPISKYIKQGNVDYLSSWFDDNLEVAIIDNTSNSSKNQAKQITKAFFESHTPRSFEITHKVDKHGMKYALGTLNAGGETYIVTIFVKFKGKDYKIQMLKIENLQ